MYLQVNNISKSYYNKKVIDNIFINVKKNETVSILGKSGIGKTTLFNIISGLESADIGNIILDGEDITSQTGKMGYMLQKDLLLPNRTILENVILPLIIKGINRLEAKELALSYFKEFCIDGCEDKYPSQLSGGMRQRAAFLRTYLFSNSMLLLDEPFSALDSITKSFMHKWYMNMVIENNITSLLITHDVDEAILLSNRIYIMFGCPSRIIEEIEVPMKSKIVKELYFSDEFVKLKKCILSKL